MDSDAYPPAPINTLADRELSFKNPIGDFLRFLKHPPQYKWQLVDISSS